MIAATLVTIGHAAWHHRARKQPFVVSLSNHAPAVLRQAQDERAKAHYRSREGCALRVLRGEVR